MRIATTRHRSDALPGVCGGARVDRRAGRLANRLRPGDIAIIDHVDLDRVTAEALVGAKPAAIINAQPSISGRYPNLGPELIVSSGILLLDDVGGEIFGAVKEGTRVRVDDDTVFIGDSPVATGTRHDLGTITARMAEARIGLSTQLTSFTADAGEFLTREKGLLLDGGHLPQLATPVRGRHVVVAVRGYDYERDLKAIKSYVREYKPVLIGIDGGADALLEAGYKPDMIVGDMDAVSDAAFASRAEVVVRAHPDGLAPGLARVQDLGIDAITFPTSCTSEDVGLLLAHDNGAEVIVTVGTHATLDEFLDKGREGMASTFLTRLAVGSKIIDAQSVTRIYRNRISGLALVLLVIGALVAVGAVLAVGDSGHNYLTDLHHAWDNTVQWVKDRFS